MGKLWYNKYRIHRKEKYKNMLMNDNQYLSIIENIKTKIGNAQFKAAVSVNRELVMLYYISA